jgi:hypothetical protein
MLAGFGRRDHLGHVQGVWRGQEDRLDQRVGDRLLECGRESKSMSDGEIVDRVGFFAHPVDHADPSAASLDPRSPR